MKFKEKLHNADLFMTMEVCVIPSAVVTQAIASAGADAVLIDQEHGAIDIGALHAMIAATAGTNCSPLVRIPEIGAAHVKRALDMGAEGIVFPLVRTADDAQACVSMINYPPNGQRGWGPFIAHSRWKVPLMDYLSTANNKIVCILLIETTEALENIESICAVSGIDCAFIAKFDLSTSMGISGQFDHPRFLEAITKIQQAVLRSGIPLGGGPARTQEEAHNLFSRGYRLIAGFDLLYLKNSVSQSSSWAHSFKR